MITAIRGKIWEKNGRSGLINTLRCIGIFKPATYQAPGPGSDFDDNPPF